MGNIVETDILFSYGEKEEAVKDKSSWVFFFRNFFSFLYEDRFLLNLNLRAISRHPCLSPFGLI